MNLSPAPILETGSSRRPSRGDVSAEQGKALEQMNLVRGNLHRLLYCSKVRLTPTTSIDVELPKILKVAQAHNRAVDVTGALLVCNGWFLQELEGPMQSVLETYGRITRDPRHEELTLIEAIPTRERSFANWSMCGLQVSPVDREIVQVLSSGGSFDPTRLSATRALNLLVTVGKMQQKSAVLL
jgi:hypothetical protein